MRYGIRLCFFVIGLCIFSYGIAIAIQVKYLGISPWDVLNVALFDKFGFSIGTWNIIVGIFLISITLKINRKYINIGTFLNAVLVGVLVDTFLYFELLPKASSLPFDVLILCLGIVLMGIGGGMYSAAGIGAGPRDGFMLSLAEKTGISISRVRILMECFVLIIGLLIGGPVFVFTFIYTFIQSPIYQRFFHLCSRWIDHILDTIQVKKKVAS
ncbi:YczE/YyaS/YitT family protein [Fictibacillus phosphorivorans]|uniref:YczE/YyaS/YitT family protein n=1 Tax=Fictibacillus phosphorivorans TaxID=1221500 RepID=UPI0020411041|nr:YitT family protein [Fictibacillus phosphorivorans]MCM3719351.1 YitT family protein [Fictibacillus phosphorivorans]MCM3776972.1 YitT family protein [Fictibacillus phosphorivorans]